MSITEKTIIVVQTGSPIRRNKKQIEYLKSLGLGKINRKKVLVDSPSVHALVKKVSHMVRVEA